MEQQNVHFDTWAIMEVIFGRRHANDVEGIAEGSGPESYSVVVSQAALGEADAVILRQGPDAARMLFGLLGLLADFRMEPGRCMPPVDAAVLSIIIELMDVVPELDMTDRIILAHALADPDSIFLITNDKMMVNNSAIRRYERRLRDQGRRRAKLVVVSPGEAFHVLQSL